MGSKNDNDNNEKLSEIIAYYNQLATLYSKSQQLLDAFNSRYRSLPSKSGIDAFLADEIDFVKNLIKKEENNRKTIQERQQKIEKGHAIIDAHLQQNTDRITKYPMLNIENSNNEELMYLFGAIDELDRLHWGVISKFLRGVFPIRAKSPLEIIENQMSSMLSGQVGKPPIALAGYVDMLKTGDAYRIDNVAFNATKEVAFFLNDTITLLDSVNFPNDNASYLYLKDIINNFRLNDIKQKKRN
jgi:hypothetical protein